MPRRLGVVLDRLRGVLGVIWRRVGVSGKRRKIFRTSLRLLGPSCRFSSGFGACWKRLGGILEASGKHFGSVLGRLLGVFSGLQGDITVIGHLE